MSNLRAALRRSLQISSNRKIPREKDYITYVVQLDLAAVGLLGSKRPSGREVEPGRLQLWPNNPNAGPQVPADLWERELAISFSICSSVNSH